MNIQDCHRPPKPAPTEPPGKDNYDSYGDDDIPEIDTTKDHTETTSHFPEEMPKRGQML